MQRAIIAYHRDNEGHWVAQLECGHNQHVRHRPPWFERPWVTTAEGRASMLGKMLACKKCDRQEPADARPRETLRLERTEKGEQHGGSL